MVLVWLLKMCMLGWIVVMCLVCRCVNVFLV